MAASPPGEEAVPFLSVRRGSTHGSSPQLVCCFLTLTLLYFLINADHGAVPAALGPIASELGMSFFEQGVVGAAPYIGLILVSLVTSPLLSRAPRAAIALSLLGECCSLCLVAVTRFATGPGRAPLRWPLALSRFGAGACQGVVAIFVPVWIDEFAPTTSRARWMASVQAAVPLGIMAGYLSTGAVLARLGPSAWWVVFVLQAMLLCPLIVVVLLVPRAYFTIDMGAAGGGTGGPSVEPRRNMGAADGAKSTHAARADGGGEGASAAVAGGGQESRYVPPSVRPSEAFDALLAQRAADTALSAGRYACVDGSFVSRASRAGSSASVASFDVRVGELDDEESLLLAVAEPLRQYARTTPAPPPPDCARALGAEPKLVDGEMPSAMRSRSDGGDGAHIGGGDGHVRARSQSPASSLDAALGDGDLCDSDTASAADGALGRCMGARIAASEWADLLPSAGARELGHGLDPPLHSPRRHSRGAIDGGRWAVPLSLIHI